MGLLEKERVLYILVFLSLLVCTSEASDNHFFNSKVDYFAEPKQECTSCQAQDEMNKKVSTVLEKTKINFEHAQRAAEITLFLDSSCRFSNLAIRNLTSFVEKHSDVTVKISVGGPTRDFLDIGRDLIRQHPNWGLANDLTGSNAKNLGVTKAPAYIFNYQGRLYRIYGTPDLEETWGKINVSIK